jgi:hypothetical protein
VRSKHGGFVKNIAVCRDRALHTRFRNAEWTSIVVIGAPPVMAAPPAMAIATVGTPTEMAPPAIVPVFLMIGPPAVMAPPPVMPAIAFAPNGDDRCWRDRACDSRPVKRLRSGERCEAKAERG